MTNEMNNEDHIEMIYKMLETLINLSQGMGESLLAHIVQLEKRIDALEQALTFDLKVELPKEKS